MELKVAKAIMKAIDRDLNVLNINLSMADVMSMALVPAPFSSSSLVYTIRCENEHIIIVKVTFTIDEITAKASILKY